MAERTRRSARPCRPPPPAVLAAPALTLSLQWEPFDELRARVEREWSSLPRTADVLSPSLKAKRAAVAERLGVQDQFQQ